MATRSLVQLRGFIESVPGGSRSIAPTDIQNNTPPGSAESSVELAYGSNSIVIPEDAIGAIIIPPEDSENDKSLKGDGADIGVPLRVNTWSVYTFPDDTGSFVIEFFDDETTEIIRIVWF